MDLAFTPEEQAFRDEVRAFIAENHPKELGDFGMREDMTREEMVAWHKILGAKGWSVPAWPVEYGGTGWSAAQLAEMQRAIAIYLSWRTAALDARAVAPVLSGPGGAGSGSPVGLTSAVNDGGALCFHEACF